MTHNVLVFGEFRDGHLHPVTLQCMSVAAQLAAAGGGQVHATVIGSGVGETASTLAKAGAAKVFVVDQPELARYSPLACTRALAAVIKNADPAIVLLPASFMGRDLAPRLAARLNAGLATDCVELKLEGGALLARRPIYNGKALSTVHFDAKRLQIASVRPNAFPAADAGNAGGEIVPVAVPLETSDSRQVTKEIVRTGGEEKDVTEAAIVISGGRSLKSKENFQIIYDLAHAVDGAVGASRAACDAGYQPHSRQVGLTGKTITPQLYIACGISGAIQHLAGMRGSRRIVAINTDKEAPIFKIADYGVVADLFAFVPLLTAEVKKLRG